MAMDRDVGQTTTRISADGQAAGPVDQTLRESERMLATLLANLPGMAYRCRNDKNWTIDFVSEGCRELTGYAPDDLLGNRTISYQEIVHPQDRARIRDEVQTALAGTRRFELTYRIVTVAGVEKWVREHGVAINEVNGTLCFLEGIVTDVTARKRAEEALAEKESMLSAILDHSFQFTGLLDPTGRLLRANQTSLDAIGVSRGEVQGCFFWDTPWWSHSADEQRRVREAISRAAQGEFVRYETTHHAKDGNLLIMDFSLNPVRDGEGRVIALIPEGRDITHRKNTERALRESEDRFSKAFRSSPDAISIVELETGRILEVNEGVERIFGYRREEVIGKTSLGLNMWADPEERTKMVAAVERDGRVRDLQLRGLLRGQTPFICLFSAERVDLDGRPCIVTVVRDITQQLKAEQALRESEEKFAKAFRASPDAISVSEAATGRIMDVNEGFERLSGYSRAELIGRTSQELGLWTAPGDRQRMLDALRASGSVREMQVVARQRDGVMRTFLMSAESVEIAGRTCLVVLSRDISGRLQAEQALRESEEKFAKAFRSSPYSLTITEQATGRYLDVNYGFERLSGYRREEVIGRLSTELGVWHDPADREELVRKLQQDGMVRGMEIKFLNRSGDLTVTRCSCELTEMGGEDLFAYRDRGYHGAA